MYADGFERVLNFIDGLGQNGLAVYGFVAGFFIYVNVQNDVGFEVGIKHGHQLVDALGKEIVDVGVLFDLAVRGLQNQGKGLFLVLLRQGG